MDALTSALIICYKCVRISTGQMYNTFAGHCLSCEGPSRNCRGRKALQLDAVPDKTTDVDLWINALFRDMLPLRSLLRYLQSEVPHLSTVDCNLSAIFVLQHPCNLCEKAPICET